MQRDEHFGKSPFDRECVVADAVAVEPFSAPNSLLTGKNTGKFIRISLVRHGSLLESADILAAFDEIPCRSEQGNFGEVNREDNF